MKMTRSILAALATASLATTVPAEEIVTNRLTASLRFGLNISAKFKGSAATLPAPSSARLTPHGDAYNYDDGYVLTDVSGNEGGQTWYWGYDNSANYPAGQVSDGVAFPANTLLFSHSTPTGDFTSPTLDDDPQFGVEVTYNRYLGTKDGASYGLEMAANYLNLSLHDKRSFSGTVLRATDAYAYTPGTTPPGASPANPYQGSYDGWGFLLGDAPVASATAVVADGYTISGTRQLDADLWGWRLGAYMDFPIEDNLNLWVSAGLAMGALKADANWNETVTLGTATATSAGRGSHSDLLWGWYASANLSWDFSERWSAVAGVQFQDLGKYKHNFGGRAVELDLSRALFITLGASYRF